MKLTRHRMALAAVVAAGIAAVGTGAAFATGTFGSSQTPQQRQEVLLQDLAGKLGVTVDKLKEAIKGVAGDQIDQALADGKITQAEADALKQKLEAGTLPFGLGAGIGGFGRGHGGMFGGGMQLDAAATYLGVTQAELRTELQAGKTLAQVAQDKGKTVAGLEQAMIDAQQADLDQAVKDGKLTAAEETTILADLKNRIDAIVNGTKPAGRGGMRGGFGFGAGPQMHGGFGAPAQTPNASQQHTW
jgi:hypothetical protein